MGEVATQEVARTVRFEQCNCGVQSPHGYFEDMSGERIDPTPAFLKEHAQVALDQLSANGAVQPEEVALIKAEIEAVPLAESGEALLSATQSSGDLLTAIFGGESSFFPGLPRNDAMSFFDSRKIGGLLDLIFGKQPPSTPSTPPYSGPHTFSVETEDESELPIGRLKDREGVVRSNDLRTRAAARASLEWWIRDGYVKEEEREGLHATIESSKLPEEESAEQIAERTRVSFRVAEVDGERAGWFFRGRSRIKATGPIHTQQGALEIIAGHEDRIRLIDEVSHSGLPRG